MPVPIALVSVIPQPVPGIAFSKESCMFLTCSGARGAPPPPTLANVLKSLSVFLASWTRSPVIAAGAIKEVIFSRSISSAAREGSHLYIDTIFLWLRKD